MGQVAIRQVTALQRAPMLLGASDFAGVSALQIACPMTSDCGDRAQMGRR
jgi:hypothetical protein